MRKMSIMAPAVAGASLVLLASPLWAQETAWHAGYPGSQHMAGWYGG